MVNEEIIGFEDEINKIMNDYVDLVFQLSQENLVRDNKVDTANLLKSGNIKRERLKKEIIYSAPYSEVPEFGRTSGKPMYSGWLEGWVKRKLGIRKPSEIKRVAFLIARAITKRGIEATPYLRPAIEQANSEFGFTEV